MAEFADDNFKFDEDSRKFSKRVENTVGKGEIARNEQFLLFPPCFQNIYTAVTLNCSHVKHGLISIDECNTIVSAYTMYRHIV